MPAKSDWENYGNLYKLVSRIRAGEKDVFIPDELGQWFESQMPESGEKGSVFSEGEATSITATLLINDYKGWQFPLGDMSENASEPTTEGK